MMELCGLPQMANPPSVWTYPSDCKGGPFTGTTPNLLGTYPASGLARPTAAGSCAPSPTDPAHAGRVGEVTLVTDCSDSPVI